MTSNRRCVAAFLVVGIALSGCAGAIPPMDDPDTTTPEQSSSGDINLPQGSIFGNDGIDLLDIFGGGGGKSGGVAGGGIGVNSYLWRASLDTISFMPLSSADPFGGVIITDWYTPPETPNERFKMNVYILGRQLRADGIRVSLFRQNLGNGQWADAKVGKKTSVKLENKILSRARELRVAARSGRN